MPKKQKDGRYRSKITIPGVDKPVYVSGRTLRELEEDKRRKRAMYIDGMQIRQVTFHEVVIEWFNTIKRPRIRRPSTLKNYQNAINLHLLPYFSERQLLRAVTRADLQRCLDACAGLSSTPAILVHSIIRHSMAYALSERLITADPSAALLLPPTKPSRTKDALTPAQVDRLLSVAATDPFGLMIYLLYYLGIRRGEMLGLQWGDIDWDRQMLHVQRSVDFATKQKGQPQDFGPLKTYDSDRWVPIPDDLAAILRPLRSLPHLLLISAHNNEPLRSSEYRARWNRMMVAAGCAQVSQTYLAKVERWQREGKKVCQPNIAYDYDVAITPHWFRHNYITACVDAGIPPEVTMRIVGHSSYQTTIDIYTHLLKEQQKKAAVSLAGVLRSASCQKVANESFQPQ